MFEDFDFGKNIVDKYIDFNVDENLSFDVQCFSYKQDMLLISYAKKYSLAIGWLPDCNPMGCFEIIVAKDYNWWTPVLCERCREIKVLVKHMEEFVAYIQKELGE